MTNPAWLKLSKKEQIKAIRLRKQHRKERVALGQAKSTQPRKRVANKKELGIVTPKMDRHWNCGCVYHHNNQENSWTRVIVCNTCSEKERLDAEAVERMKSIKKISAKEVVKDIDFGKIITGNSHEIIGVRKENI